MKIKILLIGAVCQVVLLGILAIYVTANGYTLLSPLLNTWGFLLGKAYEPVLLVLTLTTIILFILFVVCLSPIYSPRQIAMSKLTFLSSDGAQIEAQNKQILMELAEIFKSPPVSAPVTEHTSLPKNNTCRTKETLLDAQAHEHSMTGSS